MSSETSSTFQVEPENVSAPALFVVLGFSSFIIIALVIIGAAISNMHFQDVKMAMTQDSGYPVLNETQLEGESLLEGYNSIGDGVYRIPIERAMELEALDARQ